MQLIGTNVSGRSPSRNRPLRGEFPMSIHKVSANEFLGAESIIAPGSARPDLVKWHEARKRAKAKAKPALEKPE
jgi:hypothetical protein